MKRASYGLWLVERGLLHLKLKRGFMWSIASIAYRTRNSTFQARLRKITFEVRLFWYIANRTTNITFEARLFWFVTYRTRNIAFEVPIFWFRAYRTRNITFEARMRFGLCL